MENNILVAPLNWGLGHATRCIPIVRALLQNGYTPILASDGEALALLRKEFPSLLSLELPSYEIEYPKDGQDFKWKMLRHLPKMYEAILEEKKIVKQWVKEHDLIGIISDNRLGVYHKKVQSVFITHQLNVLSGNTTWFSSQLHQRIIKKFDECWVPDVEEKPNLSGKLGHLKKPQPHVRYLGPLSRLELKEVPLKYDLMVILSGPEPQRSMLEHRLRDEIDSFQGNVVFVCGKMALQQSKIQIEHVTFYNFMTSEQLEQAYNESKMVLCRSGYTTIMDLVKLRKKAFLIPTPGQFEQEYLAKRLKKHGIFPSCKQEDFSFDKLLELDLYQKPSLSSEPIHWKQLFCLFEREGKL